MIDGQICVLQYLHDNTCITYIHVYTVSFIMLVHDGAATDPHPSYSGVRHAFRSIIKELGWKGLYQVRNFNVFFCVIKKHIYRYTVSFILCHCRELFQTFGVLACPGDYISLGWLFFISF